MIAAPAASIARPLPPAGRTRVWVALIVAGAFALRLAALLDAWHRGGARPWVDPDDYLGHAQRLLAGGFDYHAFMYGGPLVKAPLYPLVLAVFAAFPAYPFTAAIFQVVVASAAAGAMYVLGREMHSPAAGIAAAAIYAVWLPAVTLSNYFLQEQLHVPLVIAGLALLARASARSAGPAAFAGAGVVLGLAALARSMPLYYIGPAAVLYVAMGPDRRAAMVQAAALVGGFVLVVLPWCVYISAQLGQVIPIDNMGSASLGMTYKEVKPDLHTAPPATLVGSLGMLWRAATREPARFWSDRLADFQRLFRLVGGQWLELQGPVATRARALGLKSVAHASDALFALSAILAPLGVVLARSRREASLVALWVALHLGLLVTFAWNGVRYRAPYEPELVALAAIVVAGRWRRSPRLAFATAAAVSAAIAVATAASVPGTAAAHANYGFDAWTHAGGAQELAMTGAAGFGVLTTTGQVTLDFPADPARDGPVRVGVSIDGRHVDEVTIDAGERRLRYAWPPPVAYIELRAADESTGRPAKLRVRAAARR